MRKFSALLLAASCSACSAEAPDAPEPQGPTAAASVSARWQAVSRSAPGALDLARRLAAPEARLSRMLRASDFVATSAAFETLRARADETTVRLPLSGSEAIEFRAGKLTKPLFSIHELGLPQGTRELAQGHAVRRTANLDVIWSTHGDTLEQSLILHNDSAPHEFAWQLVLRHDITDFQHQSDGSIAFETSDGDSMVRVLAPIALDADGRRVPMSMRFRQQQHAPLGGRLIFRVTSRASPAIRYPLLVDPVIGTVTWTEKTMVTPPAHRSLHAMAYDPVRKRAVMYGGNGFTLPGGSYLGDTWEWDGKVWTPVAATGPGKRRSHAMSYFDDGQTSGILLFGGEPPSAPDLSDTWLFDGTKWTPMPAAASPPARAGHAMVYVSSLKRVLLYGGAGSNPTFKKDAWLYDGKTWTQAPTGATDPPVLFEHAMTYSPKTDRVLLFGGRKGPPVTDETWQWAAATQTWSLASVAAPPAPTARAGHAMAHNTLIDRTVLFGGEDLSVYYGDTYAWDGTTWCVQTPLVNIDKKRSGAAAAYDEDRDRIVLFGGFGPFGVPTWFDDTWVYRRFGGKCATTADCDGAACVDGVCCLQSQCGTCEACSAVDGKCAPVQNAVDPDSCSGNQSCDASGVCKKAEGETCSDASECANGQCADGRCCNQACTNECEACDLAGQEGNCSLVSGAPRHGSCPGVGTCGASCDGQSATCTFTAKGVDCGSVCQGSVINRSQCDGSGNCLAAGPEACLKNFQCADSEKCRTNCSDDNHCVGGFHCRNGECVDPLGGSICSDDFTAKDPGGKETSCAPFKCAGGVCRDSCSDSEDCASGFVCKDFKCSPARADESDDSGCGCRSAPRPRSHAAWLGAALAALALGRRRRGRKRGSAQRDSDR